MTPAITLANKHKIDYVIHEYEHESNNHSYGLEAAEKLNIDPAQVFKTLVVCLDNKTLAVAIIPAANKLNMKQVARAFNAKKAEMAKPEAVVRSTGYILGGVSPLGQKKHLATVIDSSAENFDTIYVSAGKRGLEMELAPSTLQTLTKAQLNTLI